MRSIALRTRCVHASTNNSSHPWLTATLRDALRALARRRVPEADVDDVVQVVLAEAALSANRPADPTQARRWLYGILRNKIADYHRRPKREELVDSVHEHAARSDDTQEVRSLLEWAMRELPPGMDAQRTLAWLVRESEGETLEEIARAEQLPPEQVRQRVSRLRRFFRERWVAQAAAAIAFVLLAAVVLWPRREPAELQADRGQRPDRTLPAGDQRTDAAVDAGSADAATPDDGGDTAEDASLGALPDASSPSRDAGRPPRSGRTNRGSSTPLSFGSGS